MRTGAQMVTLAAVGGLSGDKILGVLHPYLIFAEKWQAENWGLTTDEAWANNLGSVFVIVGAVVVPYLRQRLFPKPIEPPTGGE